VPAGRTAQAFTWVYSLITIGIAAGNAIGGPTIQHAGNGAGFLFAAAAAGTGAGVGALALLIRRRALDLARRNDRLTALSNPRWQHLEERARRLNRVTRPRKGSS
jgi:hypothetical protein